MDRNATILASTITGQGPALILLHGLFGSRRNWGVVAKEWQSHFTVHAVDLPNHGDSFFTPSVSYSTMAEAVRDYMDYHQCAHATVVGHSMGGKVAMTLALETPDRVSSLVLEDIAPTQGHPEMLRSYVRVLQSLDLTVASSRQDVDRRLQPSIPDKAVRLFLLQNLVQDEGQRWRWKLNLPVLEKDMDSIVGFPDVSTCSPYKKPALFVRGGLSNYIRAEHIPLIHQLFPLAAVKTIDNAGHWVHADQPGDFTQVVTPFLFTGTVA